MAKPLVANQSTYASNKRLTMTAALMIEEKAVDQIYDATPILQQLSGVAQKNLKISDLRSSKTLKLRSGGLALDFKARTGRNNTWKSLGGYDTVKTTAQEGFTTLSETWRLYAGTAALDLESELQNGDSESKELDNLQETIDQSMAEGRDMIQADLWTAAASLLSTDLTSIPTYVAATPTTGTVATANRATETWFRNKFNGTGGFVTDTAPVFGNVGLEYMLRAIIAASGGQGVDEPTDIWNATDVYRFFYLRLQPQERYMSESNDPAARHLLWDGKRMRYDASITAGQQYFLNYNYFQWNVHRRANFSITEFVQNQETLAKVAKIIFYGNLICTRPARQAVITGWV